MREVLDECLPEVAGFFEKLATLAEEIGFKLSRGNS